jgi:hypothetical protein
MVSLDRMGRVPQPPDGDERSILVGWLTFHRDTLEAKCSGLSGTQLATRSAEPSALSLLGLVRHMTEMERVYANRALRLQGWLAPVHHPQPRQLTRVLGRRATLNRPAVRPHADPSPGGGAHAQDQPKKSAARRSISSRDTTSMRWLSIHC